MKKLLLILLIGSVIVGCTKPAEKDYQIITASGELTVVTRDDHNGHYIVIADNIPDSILEKDVSHFYLQNENGDKVVIEFSDKGVDSLKVKVSVLGGLSAFGFLQGDVKNLILSKKKLDIAYSDVYATEQRIQKFRQQFAAEILEKLEKTGKNHEDASLDMLIDEKLNSSSEVQRLLDDLKGFESRFTILRQVDEKFGVFQLYGVTYK